MSEQNAIEPGVLFVGNIAYSILDNELASIFAEAGLVVATHVVLDERERSRGFGFVRMETTEEADKALQLLDGKEIDERPLRVSAASKDSRYISLVTV